jgi:hypothetical protein
MARKSRTPAPPRRVQAPQRRSDPKRPRNLGGRSLWLGALVLAALIAGAVLAVAFARGGDSSSKPKVPNQSDLVGLQVGPAPWNQAIDTLPDRLDTLGLTDMSTEGQVLHIHQHLDIFVNGTRQPVPANIGIGEQYLTELHTHDPRGIIHVESPVMRQYDLGEFFGVWGVRLSPDCIGGYCRQVTPWTLYVNGQAYRDDPRALVLREHQQITFVIGTPPKKIPSKYKFPAGL